MDKSNIFNKLKEEGIVAVIRNSHPHDIVKIADSLIKGGVRAIEVTIENENGLEALKVLKNHYDNHVLLGAGTILTLDKAEFAIDLGVDFIVTPTVSKKIIKLANNRKCIVISGAMTPTEILTAYTTGADIVKVFPISSFNLDYLNLIKGPLEHIPLMVTGGINLDNINLLTRHNPMCIGIGSAIYRYDNEKKISNTARKFKKAFLRNKSQN